MWACSSVGAATVRAVGMKKARAFWNLEASLSRSTGYGSHLTLATCMTFCVPVEASDVRFSNDWQVGRQKGRTNHQNATPTVDEGLPRVSFVADLQDPGSLS